MKALQDLAARIHRADSLETLVDSILAGLEESFGFKHSMILVPGDEERRARHDRDARLCGERRRRRSARSAKASAAWSPKRASRSASPGCMRGMLYAFAMHKRRRAEPALCRAPRAFRCPACRIPRASSACRCSCAASSSACCCLESEVPYRFHEEDKASIELLGSYLAIAIQNMQLQERSADRRRRAGGRTRRRAARPPPPAAAHARPRRESSTTPPTSASWSTAST